MYAQEDMSSTPRVRKYLWGRHFWSGSYFARPFGGATLTVVEQCIETSNAPYDRRGLAPRGTNTGMRYAQH